MGTKDGDSMQQSQQQQQQQQLHPSRNKLTDKKTIHDLFDMLQQQTLSPASPISTSTTTTNSNNDDVRNLFDEQSNTSMLNWCLYNKQTLTQIPPQIDGCPVILTLSLLLFFFYFIFFF